MYYNATLCYLASGSFYTGISEVVVVVGTKRLFVWGGGLAQLFATAMEL